MPRRSIWFALLALGVCPMLAYRPAVDTVGPLTAKIEGPQQIARADAPVEIAVVLDNAGSAALQGTLQVRGIDGWEASPPGPVPFSVPPQGSARLPFVVRIAAVTYNAHYPIHAFVDFEWQGRRQRAHPILVIPVRLAIPPRPALPADWQPPVAAPAAAVSPAAFPPEGKSRALGTAGGYAVRVWPGQRGMLDATVGFEEGSRRIYFRGFQVRVLGQALEDPRSAMALAEAREDPAGGRYRVRHRFNGPAGPFDVVTEMWIEKGALRTRFALENAASRPWLNIHLEDVAAGPWSRRAARIYAGAGNVMQDAKAFSLKYNGHFLSTSYIGMDFEGGVSLVQARRHGPPPGTTFRSTGSMPVSRPRGEPWKPPSNGATA